MGAERLCADFFFFFFTYLRSNNLQLQSYTSDKNNQGYKTASYFGANSSAPKKKKVLEVPVS